MKNYLITGVSGFVGRHLAVYLAQKGLVVRGSARQNSKPVLNIPLHLTGDIDHTTQWSDALHGIDVVMHLAATVHRPDIQDPQVYHVSITQATENLTHQAVAAGVKRLVYLSTSHVYGVNASPTPIAESHSLQPITPYGCAKMAAENILLEVAQNSELEVVIVRPPLVYGPGVKGNFAQLIRLVQRLPILPFGAAHGKRSFVGIQNLVEFLYLCGQHPDAANRVFNISDDQDISTRELCVLLAEVLGKRRILLPIPGAYMQRLLKIVGRADLYEKLFESVCLDISLSKNMLGWRPSLMVEQQLKNLF